MGGVVSRFIIRSSIAAVLAAAAVLVAPVARADDDAFGAIRVAANRGTFVGRCPIDITFTGNINLNLPHPRGLTFNYYWVRSDGARSPVTVVHPGATQKLLIVREPWHFGAPGRHYDAAVTLFVNSGNTHLEQASSAVSVTCN
jgi:hypothetical protein